MSRINTQVGVSASPGVPAGVGSVNPGQFTPVVDNTANNLLGLVQSIVGTVSDVRQINKRNEEQALQQAFEASSANLIRLREEAIRDPSKETAFVRVYEEGISRFKGTQHEAEFTRLGETTATLFSERLERRLKDARTSFFANNIVPAVRSALLEDGVLDEFDSIADYATRLERFEDFIISILPDDFLQSMSDDERTAVRQMAINLTDASQGRFERAQQRLQQEVDARNANTAAALYSTGDSTYDDAIRIMRDSGLSAIDSEKLIASSISARFDELDSNPSVDTVQTALIQAGLALVNTVDPSSRAEISGAIKDGSDILARTVSSDLGTVKVNALKNGLNIFEADQEVDTLVRLYSTMVLGDEAKELSVEAIDLKAKTMQGTEGIFLRTLVKQRNLVVGDDSDSDLTDTVAERISSLIDMNGAPEGSAEGLLQLSQQDWIELSANVLSRTDFSSALVKRSVGVEGDEDNPFDPQNPKVFIGNIPIRTEDDVQKVMSLSMSDPAMRASFIAAIAVGTQQESAVVEHFTSPKGIDTYTRNAASFEVLTSALDALSGGTAEGLSVALRNLNNDSVKYALIRTLSSPQPSVDDYMASKSEYESIRITNFRSIRSAMADKRFLAGFLGQGVFDRTSNDFRLSDDDITKILAFVDIQDLEDRELSVGDLGAQIRRSLRKNGAYIFLQEKPLGGGVPSLVISMNPTIPEAALNVDSRRISDAISVPTASVPVQRRIATMLSGGETSNIYEHTLNVLTSINGIEDPLEDRDESKKGLMDMIATKQGRFSLRPSEATADGTPIVFEFSYRTTDGRRIRGEYNIGSVDFTDPFISTAFGENLLHPSGVIRDKVHLQQTLDNSFQTISDIPPAF